MQTLIFNTTEKTIKLISNTLGTKPILDMTNIPTVKVENGYYEVMQKDMTHTDNSLNRVIPVLRLPINYTNMIIEK